MTVRYGKSRGFTLVEVLIAMVIMGIVSTAIYGVYFSQNRTFLVQEQVVDMQQNLRVVMDYLAKDLRHIGYQRAFSGLDVGITAANPTGVTFTTNRNGRADNGVDDDGDGNTDEADELESHQYVFDSATRTLTRDGRALSDQIDNLEFYYLLDDGTWTTSPPAERYEDIRAARITVLSRTDRADPDYLAATAFTPPSGGLGEENEGLQWTHNDGFRRRLLTTMVRCRNMGL